MHYRVEINGIGIVLGLLEWYCDQHCIVIFDYWNSIVFVNDITIFPLVPVSCFLQLFFTVIFLIRRLFVRFSVHIRTVRDKKTGVTTQGKFSNNLKMPTWDESQSTADTSRVIAQGSLSRQDHDKNSLRIFAEITSFKLRLSVAMLSKYVDLSLISWNCSGASIRRRTFPHNENYTKVTSDKGYRPEASYLFLLRATEIFLVVFLERFPAFSMRGIPTENTRPINDQMHGHGQRRLITCSRRTKAGAI